MDNPKRVLSSAVIDGLGSLNDLAATSLRWRSRGRRLMRPEQDVKENKVTLQALIDSHQAWREKALMTDRSFATATEMFNVQLAAHERRTMTMLEDWRREDAAMRDNPFPLVWERIRREVRFQYTHARLVVRVYLAREFGITLPLFEPESEDD